MLTHDTMVEGVHWLAGQDLADVAWKLVAVNLSDLAAKGAEPIGVLLSYMLGDEHADRQFTAGLEDALLAFDVPLLGGDTVSGGNPRTFGLTAVGRACHRPVPSRAGARPGDTVWITGPVGAALMGFEALHAGRHGDSRAYRRPTPLLREGAALAPYVSAMMDVSDGLLLDASRMAGASGVTIDIAVHSVPIAAPEERRGDALRWGDDYQLLFTAPADYMPLVAAQAIGTVLPRGASALLLDGSPPAPGDRLGYEHAANGGVR